MKIIFDILRLSLVEGTDVSEVLTISIIRAIMM
jgi:hypothetical protein